jgi:hypothetical protein
MMLRSSACKHLQLQVQQQQQQPCSRASTPLLHRLYWTPMPLTLVRSQGVRRRHFIVLLLQQYKLISSLLLLLLALSGTCLLFLQHDTQVE